jgi:hypothetical protein
MEALFFIFAFLLILSVIRWAGKPATGKPLDIGRGVGVIGTAIHSGQFDREWKQSKE